MLKSDVAPETPLARWMAEHKRDDEFVASALNVGRSQVNRLRRGVSRPSLETAKALEELTGISVISHLEAARPRQDAAA